VKLRLKLALAFAAVALATAGAVAVASPFVIAQGFAQLRSELGVPGGVTWPRPGSLASAHIAQVEQDMMVTIIALAMAAAALALMAGILLAERIVRPLRRLEDAAASVARGKLDRRSGLAERRDELGQLGRSFDMMAADLERSDRSRRRFLQDAVHELRTPLAVIDATASAVLDGVYAHEDRYLETIRDQSRVLARIVEDLRTISLAEGGALPLRREPVAIADLLAGVAESFAALAAARGVALRVPPAGPHQVSADRGRLHQALGGLLDNALRHTPAGGEVLVTSRAVGPAVRIEVADTGPGVAEADLPHLFERFYQADLARDRTTGTSGLGLAIVRAIVEAHEGRAGVENRFEGGARFWIELPLGRAAG